MKPLYLPFLLFFLFLSSLDVAGQCLNSSGGIFSHIGATIGSSESIGCNLATEYGTWSGILSNYSYTTTSDNSTDFITISAESPSGPVVAFGNQPLTWTASVSGTYFIHTNTNSTCGTEAVCREITTTNNGPANPCSGTANPGNVISSVEAACSGASFQLSLTGASVASGLNYQWQSSTDGITFTPIPGATSSTCNISQTALTYYNCIVTCPGGAPSIATPLTIDMGTCAIMTNGSISSCIGNFYDSGGTSGNYQNNESDTLTITPSSPGGYLQVIFNSFDLDPSDEMTIYNGNSVLSPLIGTFSTTPGAITSSASDGSLTFVFTSDNAVTTSGWKGIIKCVTPAVNDSVCSAMLIPVNGSINYFNNGAATVETNETNIAPPSTGFNTSNGWGTGTLEHTVWFTFNAPNSGNVTISCTHIEIDGQLAVYKVGNCANFSSFQLIAANDNDVDYVSQSPEFTVCGLIPGETYYILYDSGNKYASGPFSISISELSMNAGISAGIVDVCSGDTVNLNDGISGNDLGGIWKQTIPTFGLSGSLWNTAGVAYQVFNFQYILQNGCLADTALSQVHVFGPSSAGNDGIISACKQETINLLSGLSGNVDLGGIWYNPSNQAIIGSVVTTSGIPGQFNYDYIASNGVCPDDTSNILVIVSDCIASLDDIGIEALIIYPNPSRGVFYLKGANNEPFDLKITDIDGRLVSFEQTPTENGIQIEITNASTGFYFLHVTKNGIPTMEKISIQ